MPPFRPRIEAGFVRDQPIQPRVNPGAFGLEGEAIQTFAGIAQEEIRFRTEAHQATQLASARATAQTEINDFLQELERNPDFTTYPQAWAEKRAELQTRFQQSLDPLVWSTFESDWITMSGSGTRSVRDLAYARESDHLIAGLTTSQNTLIEQAGRPGVDHARNIEMIRTNYLEAFRSGLISETDAVNFAARDAERYRYTQEYAAIGRDPVGWLGGQDAPVASDPNAPRGVRNNNPLNIRRTNIAWQGETEGLDEAFETFVSPEHGIAAAVRNLQAYQDRHGIRTIGEAIARWAPESENDTAAYIARIEERTGLTADTPLDARDFRQMQLLIPAMVEVENGAQPYDAETFVQGFSLAGVGGGSRSREGWPEPITAAVEAEGREFIPPSRPSIPGLTPEQNDALYNRALREAERALTAARVEVQGQAQDYITALTNGVDMAPPADDQIMHAFMTDPSEGAELISSLRSAEELVGTFEEMHGMSATDLDAFMASEREAALAPGEGITERAQRLEALQGAAERIREARKDPGGYVVGRDDDLRQAFEEALGDEGTPEMLGQAIQRSLAAQDRLGLERRPLPDAMVSSVMEHFARLDDVGERLRMLESMTIGLQDDKAASLVLDQMEAAGLDEAMRYVVFAPGSDAQRVDMVNLLLDPEAEERWKQRFPEEAERNEALLSALQSYDEARGNTWDDRIALLGFGAAEDQRRDRAVAERLAIAIATRIGDPEDPAAAMDQAVGLLYGDQVAAHPDIGPAFLPADNAPALATGMARVRSALLDIDPLEQYGALLGIEAEGPTDAERARFVWEGIIPEARWVNEGSGYALALPVADGLMRRLLPGPDGNPRIWTAEELMAEPRVARPSTGGPGEMMGEVLER